MAIYNAVFRNGDIEEDILIDSIEKHGNFEVVRSNLYCSFEDCTAKLEYVPKGKHRAHFKTWPKQNHSIDCLDYFEREKKANREKNTATINVALSDQHIANILREIKRDLQKPKSVNSRPNEKKKRKNTTVDTNKPRVIAVNVNPTTGDDAVAIENNPNKKAPSVRRRNLQLLNQDDVGFTRSLYANITHVALDEKRAVFSISDGKKTCNIYFEESFFTSAPSNFMGRFISLKNIVATDSNILFIGVGQVEKRDEEIHMVINHHKHFSVGGSYISIFTDTH
jgi:hypothetical protein